VSLRLTLPNIGLAVLAALVIALGATLVLDRGGDDGNITVRSVPASQGTGPAPMGVEAAKSADVPGPGSFLLLQGQQARRLVFWPLYGDEEPQIIDSHVSSSTILPDPTGEHVFYSTPGTVMVLDVDARRASIIGVLAEGSYPVRMQWSPKGQALAYVVREGTQLVAYYALADGATPAVPFMTLHEGLGLDVAWLPDGRPVAIYMGIDPGAGALRAQFMLYDPRVDAVFSLPPDATAIQPWSPWQSPDGSQQVYALQQWQGDEYRQECMTGPLVIFDDEWLPVAIQNSGGSYTTLFEIYGLFMDWPTWLRDGRIVFRGTADDACQTAESGLYIASPGGKPERLVATEVKYTYDESEKMMWNVSYAINAEETHIAWTENDPDASRSTIYLMPLDASRPPERLYQTPPVADPASMDYRNDEMILSFVWLP
jgi:hypothetical protein